MAPATEPAGNGYEVEDILVNDQRPALEELFGPRAKSLLADFRLLQLVDPRVSG